MKNKQSKKNKRSAKKVNLKFKNPFDRISNLQLKYSLPAHLLAIISLFPFMIALWIGFPTFSIERGNKIYHFSSMQPYQQKDETTGVTEIYNRIGFKEAIDLQGGVSFRFTINEDDTDQSTSSGSTATGTTTDTTSSGDTSTGDLSIGSTKKTVNKVDKTIEIIRKRLDEIGLAEARMYKITKEGEDTQIIVNMSGNREDVAGLPYYFTLQGGDVQVWIDDPNYVAPTDTTEGYSIFDSLTTSGLTQDDIAYVSAIDDTKTGGPGLKVVFKNSALERVQSNAVNISRFGFVLLVNGQPVGFQSYGYDVNHPTTIYMTDLYGSTDLQTFRAVASVVNGETLPLSVTVTSNNNISPVVEVNIGHMKAVMFGIFVLINLLFLIKFKLHGLVNIVMSINTLVISLAVFRLFKQPLSINLILGTFIGVALVMMISIMAVNTMETINVPTKDGYKDISSKYQTILRNIAILFLWISIVLEYLNIGLTSQLSMGLGVTLMAGLISIWTVFRTFINEIFLLPLSLNAKRQRN